jgi:hypothetical protein
MAIGHAIDERNQHMKSRFEGSVVLAEPLDDERVSLRNNPHALEERNDDEQNDQADDDCPGVDRIHGSCC